MRTCQLSKREEVHAELKRSDALFGVKKHELTGSWIKVLCNDVRRVSVKVVTRRLKTKMENIEHFDPNGGGGGQQTYFVSGRKH